jgi:hypothetical protein
MNEMNSHGRVAIIIVAFSIAIGVFVGAWNETYGWGSFFLCIGVFALFYELLLKIAARR